MDTQERRQQLLGAWEVHPGELCCGSVKWTASPSSSLPQTLIDILFECYKSHGRKTWGSLSLIKVLIRASLLDNIPIIPLVPRAARLTGLVQLHSRPTFVFVFFSVLHRHSTPNRDLEYIRNVEATYNTLRIVKTAHSSARVKVALSLHAELVRI